MMKKYLELYWLNLCLFRHGIEPVFLILLLASGVIFGLDQISSMQCETFSEKIQKEYDYSTIAGCFVKHEGSWIHKDNLRIIINK
jgi:hypothetical protein